jgi:hypothetical protein
MINTQLERLVQIALQSYESVHGLTNEQAKLFELHFRRNLMQCYCNDNPTNKTHTYTINPGTVTGKWTTRECPPSTSQLLHG